MESIKRRTTIIPAVDQIMIGFTLDALLWSVTLIVLYVFCMNVTSSWLMEDAFSYREWGKNIFAQLLSVVFTLSRESFATTGI